MVEACHRKKKQVRHKIKVDMFKVFSFDLACLLSTRMLIWIAEMRLTWSHEFPLTQQTLVLISSNILRVSTIRLVLYCGRILYILT